MLRYKGKKVEDGELCKIVFIRKKAKMKKGIKGKKENKELKIEEKRRINMQSGGSVKDKVKKGDL